MKALFINHQKTQSGVYEFGRNIGLALARQPARFVYYECDSSRDFKSILDKENPALIIYNYHSAAFPWVTPKLTGKIRQPQIGIVHEITQEAADKADNSLFNFHIAHDPTLLLKNPIVFKAGRLIPRYENNSALPSITTVGSCGFGTRGKNFEKIVEIVHQEFDEAVIRFNIPSAASGDAAQIAQNCRKLIIKPDIKLEITHNLLQESEVLKFFAQNTVNVFLDEEQNIKCGIPRAPDLALAVKRPLAVSAGQAFRHLLAARPEVCLENSSLKEIIDNGIAPLDVFYREWSEEVIVWEYERIVSAVLTRERIPEIGNGGALKKGLKRVKRIVKRAIGRPPDKENFSWIGDTSIKQNSFLQKTETVKYEPAKIPDDWSLNNILDNRARELFAGTIRQMFSYAPDLMKRKIAEANVQQAFVLDTVYKIASRCENPKILCVGSFEDSAAEGLKRIGFQIDEIDPMINYDLETFVGKPTTVKNSYDVVFSTSVIEHVEKDAEFLTLIAGLLKSGGTAVLTCDYCDTYRASDPKPSVDYRLYTQQDIKERLLPQVPDCRLVDEPQWNCPNPDFYYEGFNYTFGTIVFKKI